MSELKTVINNKSNKETNKIAKSSVNKFIKENGMLIALLAVIVIFQILTKGIMLKPLNITNLIQQNGYVLILAVGMLLVVITGSVDLAVGSICAFVGALAGVFMVNPVFYLVINENYFVGSSLILGIIISIIYVLRNIKLRNKARQYSFDIESKNAFLIKNIVCIVVINIATIVLASYKGIPNILIIASLLILLYSFITSKTVFGRQVYAVGGNKKAAALSGVKIDKVQFLVFVNMGLMAALAGLAYAARVNSAQPKAGVNFELDALAACYIGGASTSGGTGRVMGAVVGGLVMGVLNNGMSLLGVDNNWQQAIKGLVLLFAVVFDLYSKKNK